MTYKTEPKRENKTNFIPRIRSYSKNSSYKEQPTEIKVRVVRLPDEIVAEIILYYDLGLMTSLSEVVRTALNDYSNFILTETNNFSNPFFISDSDKSFLEYCRSPLTSKKGISLNFPIKYIELIDLFLKKIISLRLVAEIKNRSDLIRLAIKFLLENNRSFIAFYKNLNINFHSGGP